LRGAESGSFSTSGEQSHVSQPSLSQQILSWRTNWERLFEPAGAVGGDLLRWQDVLAASAGSLRELEAARGDVVERKERWARDLRGRDSHDCAVLFASATDIFIAAISAGRVTVVEDITPVLLEAVAGERGGRSDLALPIRGHEVRDIPTAEGRSVCGAAEEHKFAGRAVISLKDFAAEIFCCCGMVTAFAIRRWRRVIGRGCIHRLFLRADSSAAS